jgi:hypothetical protein
MQKFSRKLGVSQRSLSQVANVKNFINGKFEESNATKWFDVSLFILAIFGFIVNRFEILPLKMLSAGFLNQQVRN